MSHPINVSSSLRNVFVCVVHHTYGLFSFLSVSFRECGFLRKTIIHSSCRLSQDAESSELHIQQNLGKPTNSTQHSGEACSETSWCFFCALSFCQWDALCKVREGGPPGGGVGSLGPGGSVAGPMWRRPALAEASSLCAKASLGTASDYSRWIGIQNQLQNMQRRKPLSVKAKTIILVPQSTSAMGFITHRPENDYFYWKKWKNKNDHSRGMIKISRNIFKIITLYNSYIIKG